MIKMPTEENLREILGRIPDAEVLEVFEEEPYKLTVIMRAERWSGVGYHIRQKEAWELLLKEFPTHEQLRKINFVFTCAPEDLNAPEEVSMFSKEPPAQQAAVS